MFTPSSRSLVLSIIFILSVSFSTGSCAKTAPLKTKPSKAPSANPDAATDAALGVLPEKGETEVEKQVKGVEEEEEEQTLRELREREREEDERRLHKTITDDLTTAGKR